jgi:hypothetical protein
VNLTPKNHFGVVTKILPDGGAMQGGRVEMLQTLNKNGRLGRPFKVPNG